MKRKAKAKFKRDEVVQVTLQGLVYLPEFRDGKVGVQIGSRCQCGRFKIFFFEPSEVVSRERGARRKR